MRPVPQVEERIQLGGVAAQKVGVGATRRMGGRRRVVVIKSWQPAAAARNVAAAACLPGHKAGQPRPSAVHVRIHKWWAYTSGGPSASPARGGGAGALRGGHQEGIGLLEGLQPLPKVADALRVPAGGAQEGTGALRGARGSRRRPAGLHRCSRQGLDIITSCIPHPFAPEPRCSRAAACHIHPPSRLTRPWRGTPAPGGPASAQRLHTHTRPCPTSSPAPTSLRTRSWRNLRRWEGGRRKGRPARRRLAGAVQRQRCPHRPGARHSPCSALTQQCGAVGGHPDAVGACHVAPVPLLLVTTHVDHERAGVGGAGCEHAEQRVRRHRLGLQHGPCSARCRETHNEQHRPRVGEY